MIVLENTLGPISITRDQTGIFKATSSSLFTQNKTAVQIETYTPLAGPVGGWSGVTRSTDSIVTIYTTKFTPNPYAQFANSDTVLVDTFFEIRVYP